ncbi:Transcriptional regulator [Tulasnella sp. 330]|nr:Transcriptional regulator [Tulasnella sp. 330]KAG8885963.1 Transcriptional regulator [Tulasnella sp. 331]KAG8888814.1 Transcriptional regulator [Tulasnella sp. 332]
MESTVPRPFRPFSPHSVVKSPLLHASSEHAVPPLQDLRELEAELRAHHSKALLRVKKADSELNAFDTIYRKAKERDKVVKGKVKIKEKERGDKVERDRPDKEKDREWEKTIPKPGVESFPMGHQRGEKERPVLPVVKIKREYSRTPDVDDNLQPGLSRPSLNGNRKPPNASAAKAAALKALTPPVPGLPHVKQQKPKQKRKRLDDSDDDNESISSDLMPPPSQRPRPSPHPHPSHPSSAPSTVGKVKTTIHVKPSPSVTASIASLHANGAPQSAAASPFLHPSSACPPTFHTGPANDFSLPPKPSIPAPLTGATSAGFTYTKTPTNPRQVIEDFSDRKAPSNQTPVNTFWKEVESWMKPVGEEDVAWLEFDNLVYVARKYKADDVEPFLIPALGKHYTETWEEEDRAAAIAAAALAQTWPRGYSLDRSFVPPDDPPPSASATSAITLHNPYSDTATTVPGSQGKGKDGDLGTHLDNGLARTVGPGVGIRPDLAGWDPRTIVESDLATEEKGLGPVTERIMGAFLMEPPAHAPNKGSSSREDEIMVPIVASGVTGTGPKIPAAGSKSAIAGNAISTVGDLEGRIRAELKALGLLGEEEVSIVSELHLASLTLVLIVPRVVDLQPNFANPLDDDITSTLRRCQSVLRHQRSINVARKDRLLSIARDRLAYQDYLNTLDGVEKGIIAGYTKMLKAYAPKKKKDKDKDKNGNGPGTDDTKGLPPITLDPPEAVMEKVRLREKWVAVFGSAMQDWEDRQPGRLIGLPPTSIYEGLEGEGEDPDTQQDGGRTAIDGPRTNGIQF